MLAHPETNVKYEKILSDKLNKELKYYFHLGKSQMFTWMLTTNQNCNLRLKSHLVLTCNWGMANTLTGQWETAFHMFNWHSFYLKLPDVFNDYCRLPNTFSLLTKGQSFHWQMARNLTERLIVVLILISEMTTAKKFCHEFPATLTIGCLVVLD